MRHQDFISAFWRDIYHLRAAFGNSFTARPLRPNKFEWDPNRFGVSAAFFFRI
jgi:hypothetical protein